MKQTSSGWMFWCVSRRPCRPRRRRLQARVEHVVVVVVHSFFYLFIYLFIFFFSHELIISVTILFEGFTTGSLITVGQVNEWMDQWTDEWTDEWINGPNEWVDPWLASRLAGRHPRQGPRRATTTTATRTAAPFVPQKYEEKKMLTETIDGPTADWEMKHTRVKLSGL